MTLQSGRTLGFAQYGDPKGKPLFYFHGWPVSRLSAEIYDSISKKLHIRIIAPDRPGYGLSDFYTERTLLDWPDDVVAIADTLHIHTFAVMGVSGGGPYAAVCAYKIPDRISNVGIIAGLSPIYGKEALHGVTWISKIGWENFGRYPWLRTSSSIFQYLNTRFGPSLGLHRFLFGSKKDRKLLKDKKLRERTKQTTKEAFCKGYKGPELDLKLYTTDWGFRLRDIRKKIFLWYGSDDNNVSINMGEYYRKNIPNSELIIYPDEGHLISLSHAEEILQTLCF
jgi:pimeloyl-ACP methyl ester carboxylesterase